MDEQFLYYIWKFQKFDSTALKTTEGQSLSIFQPGNHNLHSGPDFEGARIKLEHLEWAGNVELHLKSSDWYRHNHHQDKAYDNVILHVVWKDDKPVSINGEHIPTLELVPLVDPHLLENYKNFIGTESEIACAANLSNVSSKHYTNMLDRAMTERLEHKAADIDNLFEKCNNDWEATTYRCLAQNMGFSVNKEPFKQLTAQLPYSVVAKCLRQTASLEALFFGQAGFLSEPVDEYQDQLAKEYSYLVKKYKLKPALNRSMWKFGRMRPPNFPTVRLAQFVRLLRSNPHLFSNLISIENPKEILSTLKVEIDGYWSYHYDFAKPRKIASTRMGKATFENVLINTLAPLLAAYSNYVGDRQYLGTAIKLLKASQPEVNSITKKWELLDKKPKNAFDSQALIEMYQNYCTKHKCLSCNVGIELLSR